MRLLTFGIAALGLFAVVGCGDKTVNTSAVEDAIHQQVTVAKSPVSKVNCPDNVKSEKGATFNCDVSLENGTTGKVKVTQSSAGHYSYGLVPGSVQVPGAVLESQVTQALAQKGAPESKVNCPDNIIVKVGTYVVCEVTGSNGAKSSVKFTFSDPSGTVDSGSVSSS